MPDPLPDEDHDRGLLPTFGQTFETHRLVFQLSVDIGCWAIGLVAAIVLRYEFTLDPNEWGPFSAGTVLAAIGIAALLQTASGLAGGLYVGRYRFGSFDEVLHLVRSVMVTLAGLAVANQFLPRHLVPLSVTVVGALIAMTIMSAARFAWRLALERSLRPSGDSSARTLVYGAGEAGLQIITAMMRNPSSPYLPVAMFDDDPGKRHLRLLGVPVVGGHDSLVREARRLDASVLVITMPSAPPDTLSEIAGLAIDAGLQTLVLPPITELFGSAVGVSDIRPITEADLLGRHEIDTDIDAIAGYLTKRRVLVTGAGGSIGTELCRQISRFGPSELVMLDRDESALHAVQLMLEGRALLESRNLVVGDIRDRERVFEVFAEHQPDVVFHAAALKHLPLLELHPGEALKSNVFGTVHVLDAARAHGVQRFVNISTDKAADPCSVLGYTKRIAEKLTTSTAEHAEGTYLSVRFGNVLGSRGSVLTAFRSQVSSGGPITVTHPDATRYFMTVEEAVQLVIQAGAVGRDGEALVLDMGRPVRIDDVARRLAAQHTRPVDVVYTGLRPGEKLHEVLLGRGELDRRPAHPLISHVSVPALTGETVRRAVADRDERTLPEALGRLALAGFEGIDLEALESDRGRPPADQRAGDRGDGPFGVPGP
jgi:FlaA1/EpsC-like NDP-sugar epimerase